MEGSHANRSLTGDNNNTITDPELVSRLNEFLRYAYIRSIKEFENRCGLGNSSVRNFSPRSQIQKVKKIKIAFPELNVWWLFFGEGAMLLPQMEEANNCFNVHSHGGTDNTTGLMITQTTPKKLEDTERKLTDIELLSARVGVLDSNILSISKELKNYQKENERLLQLLEQLQKRCDKLTDELIRLNCGI